MKVVHSLDISVDFYQITRSYVPEDNTLHSVTSFSVIRQIILEEIIVDNFSVSFVYKIHKI
jgi:hypothetical protein